MKAQHLQKELHPLLLPWGLTVLAGGLIGLRPLCEGSGIEDIIVFLAGNGFFAGIALLGASVFGSELHERTLGLLLSQPYSRLRLWGEKMVVVSLATVAAALAEIVLLFMISRFYGSGAFEPITHELLSDHALLFGGMFLVGTICSCAFWTLVAGSTIGGFVFTVTAQFATGLASAFVASRILRQDQLFEDARTFSAMVIGEVIYSIVFFYLGWKKFAGMELRATGFGESSTAFDRMSWRGPWSGLLVSQPTGRILNLARKEVRLQKPMFQLAGLFILCWVVVLVFQRLRPRQDIKYLFDALTSLYAPITCLLVGCISFGEEKAMGLTAAQLVLPVSSWLQWLIKLAVSSAIAAVLGLGLPLLLFSITSGLIYLGAGPDTFNPPSLLSGNNEGRVAVAAVSGIMFLLGYWAISLTANTVRAALVAIAAVIILPTCAAVGMQWGHMLLGWPQNGIPNQGTALIAAAAVAGVCTLGQSLIRFSKSEERSPKLGFYSIILVALVLCVSFWATYFG